MPPREGPEGACVRITQLHLYLLLWRGSFPPKYWHEAPAFHTGTFEDHWVCEYWDEPGQRWALADLQIDDVQRGLFDVGFDLMDVPRDAFLVAGDAWRLCRDGDADPAKFGLSVLDEGGDWWIAGNLLRDVAALNNMEMACPLPPAGMMG